MYFTDIHSHLLFDLDDGARSEEEMYQGVDAAYSGGTRGLCLTPHFHPGYYHYDESSLQLAFNKLKKYVNKKYPDLELYLGNELYYSQGRLAQVGEGGCRTLNGTRYLLVDFSSGEAADKIEKALHRILSSGWIPVLAHVERYRTFLFKTERLQRLRSNGVLFQLDAGSPFGNYGITAKILAKRLLRRGLIDLVASDVHRPETQPTGMQRCYEYVCDHMSGNYAKAIFQENPRRILLSEDRKGQR